MFAATLPSAALLATAAGTAVVHTLAGPDHYLPLLAAARAHGWRPRTALAVTALAGLVHCGASALLVPFVLWLGRDLAGLQYARGLLSGWLMLGVGIALLCTAARRLRSRSASPARGLRGFLLLLFAVGPCEWLLPNALAAAGSDGAAGALLVAAVFTAATTATMLGCTALGLRLIPAAATRARWAQLAPGAVLCVCGGLALAGC